MPTSNERKMLSSNEALKELIKNGNDHSRNGNDYSALSEALKEISPAFN